MPYQGTPSPEELYSLLARAQAEGLEDAIIERLSVILHYSEHAYSISETCRTFGISRSTFHRWMERFDPRDLSTLADKSQDPLTTRQSPFSEKTTELVRSYRMRYPHMGKERISELLIREQGTDISASTVGRIIERECLYFADTPFHWKKRLQYKAANPSLQIDVKNADPEEQHAEHKHIEILPEPEPAPQRLPASTEQEVTKEERRPRGITITWGAMLRFVVVVSVLTNIVFLGLLFFSATAEKHLKNVEQATQSTTDNTPPSHAASFDTPSK